MQLRKFLIELVTLRETGILDEKVCDAMNRCNLTHDREGSWIKSNALSLYVDNIKGEGVVKFFVPAKFWGFLTPDDKNLYDIYIHGYSLDPSIIPLLIHGTRVRFTAEPSRKGLRTTSLEIIESSLSGIPVDALRTSYGNGKDHEEASLCDAS
jgi:cold shock CspA family protein